MDSLLARLLLIELALVLLLALLSAGETALHALRRPHLLEDLAERGRRGRIAAAIGESAQDYLSALQVMEFCVVFAYSAIERVIASTSVRPARAATT